jgi:hypothetical protein
MCAAKAAQARFPFFKRGFLCDTGAAGQALPFGFPEQGAKKGGFELPYRSDQIAGKNRHAHAPDAKPRGKGFAGDGPQPGVDPKVG